MNPLLLGGLVQGGATAGSSVLNTAVNLYEANKNRAFQADQAQLNRDWQSNANAIAMQHNKDMQAAQFAYETEMSNTAYQRAVTDLEKAGLNPLLAYTNLGGASTPAVSAGNGVASSPTGAPSGSTARGELLTNFGKIFEGYLRNAHEVSMAADRYQHELDMQDRKQRHEIAMLHKKQTFEKENRQKYNQKPRQETYSSFDTEDFFKAALKRNFNDD